jgi:hypothetical protein
VGVLWVMHDERAAQAVRILTTLMAVVPVCAGLINLGVSACVTWIFMLVLVYREVVSKRHSRENRALRHTNWSIHVCRAVHVQAVEMQTRALISK